MNKKLNKNWAKLLLLFSLFIFSPECDRYIYASFLDVGVSPRQMGMGEAFIGLADDVSAVHYNPAGLAQLKSPQLSANWTALYPGLDYLNNNGIGFLGYAHPTTKYGIFGGSWNQLYIAELYKENSFNISYSFPLSFIPYLKEKIPDLSEQILIGTNLKILSLSYGKPAWGIKTPEYDWFEGLEDDVFKNGTTATGVGIDLGIIYHYSPSLSLGLMLKNLNQPDIHLKNENIIPLSIGAGVCYRIPEWQMFEDIKILCDFNYSNNDYQFNIGIEGLILNRQLAIRSGTQLGMRNLANFSCGTSYLIPLKGVNFDLGIDYAFRLSLNEFDSRFGSHRIGAILYFKK